MNASARWLSTALLIAALLILGGVGYFNSKKRVVPIVFSQKAMLGELWHTYTQEYLEPGSSRTLDKQSNNITTSEGQSYTMLRAVWQDDKPTFDVSWKWTKDNLKRPTDSLPSWLFGKRPDGVYGIKTEQGGQNTASDGDTDIALSLAFAANRWNQGEYLSGAKAMISDIWNQDVVIVAGKPVLTADNLEQYSADSVVVNPSYFAPYAYRVFAKLDPAHDWNGLTANMYAVVDAASNTALNAPRSANIPPDWVRVDRKTGAVIPPVAQGQTTNYSYDAMRLPFRLALDYQWNNSQESKQLLSHFAFFSGQWTASGKLVDKYAHDGQALSSNESPAVYGGSLGYFLVSDPQLADQVYTQKLRTLYDPNTQAWTSKLGYYEDNWAWFGLALYHHELPDLTLQHG